MGRPRPDRLLSRAGRIRWHDGDDRLHRERAVGGARRHVRRHRGWAPGGGRGGGGGTPSGANGTTRTGTSPSSGSAPSGAPRARRLRERRREPVRAGQAGPVRRRAQVRPHRHRRQKRNSGRRRCGRPEEIRGAAGAVASPPPAHSSALEKDDGSYRSVAATFGSQSAANLELATNGDPVMAIGGFNNNGGNLTLAQFKAYVAAGDIHYFIASGGGGGAGGRAAPRPRSRSGLPSTTHRPP